MNNPRKIKHIMAWCVIVLSIVKALLIFLSKGGIPVLGQRTMEIMQQSNLLVGPTAMIILNAVTALVVVLLLGFVALKDLRVELCIGIGALAAINLGIYAGKFYSTSGASFPTIFFIVFCLAMAVFAFSAYMEKSTAAKQ